MESDAERGFGSAENDGEELSPVLTIMSLNRGMDSIVAKAGTLSTLENIKGSCSVEQAVAVEFAFRGGFKRLDGRGSFVAEQRAQAERWCCFGFAVASKW